MTETRPSDPARDRRDGRQALETRRFGEAAALFNRSLSVEPEDVYGLCGLAAAQFGLGDNKAALHAARRAQAVAPRMIQPLFVLAPAAFCLGDQAATSCLEALARLDRENADSLVQYWTDRLLEHDRLAEASACFEAFMSAHPPDYAALVKHAEILLNAFEPEKAIKPITRALAMQPNDARAHALRARYHLQTGAIDRARDDALHAIGLDANCLPAYLVVCDVDAGALDKAMTAQLGAQLRAANLGANVRALAGSALGRAREARGDFDGAFAAFSASKEIAHAAARAAGRGYDRSGAEEALQTEARRFPPSVFAAPLVSPERGRDLIFVVGAPRSGSTLIDQIISSHSKATSAGECLALPRVYDAIINRCAETGDDVAATIDRHADEWEALYRHGLKTGEEAQVIVDKTLQNFWFYGLIARLFPAAKILEMHRDPMDVGLSIFRLMFFGEHPYANRLEDIAHYYKCFEAMAAHWRAILPDRACRIQYEEFVENFEERATALLAYCGLAVEDACLNFHSSRRPVFTQSAAQVRAPVTTARRGRWRAYERHLEPLRRALDTIEISVPSDRAAALDAAGKSPHR